jgi:glucosamine kinase
VALFLGIDGGQTKTACTVGDEQRVLGRGEASGSNVVRVGAKSAREALRHAVRETCARAGVDPKKVARVVAGISGAARREIAEVVRGALTDLTPAPVQVVGDMVIALHAAFGDGPGVVVIAGTGSIAYARSKSGETARAGGWGWAISDEGSAHWIGREAVGAVFSCRDADLATSLGNRILAAWKLADLDQLVVTSNAVPVADFASLLKQVVAAANDGDAVAARILQDASSELIRLAKTAASRVLPSQGPVQVAMAGGVFAHAAQVREAFSRTLATEMPDATLRPDVVEPVLGALALARQGVSK